MTRMKISRREFMGAAVAVGGVAAAAKLTGPRSLPYPPFDHLAGFRPDTTIKWATDRVLLGKSGIKVSLSGIGTGSIGAGHESNQTRLGQAAFTDLIRHTFDSGINFFDLADSYGSHPFFKEAMKGVPRD